MPINGQHNVAKLILMIYDPTPLPSTIQALPKQQQKKEKQKKCKQ